jgi:hypothetical protein
MASVQAFVLGSGTRAVAHSVATDGPTSAASVIAQLQDPAGPSILVRADTALTPGAVVFISGEDLRASGGLARDLDENDLLTVVLPYPDS